MAPFSLMDHLAIILKKSILSLEGEFGAKAEAIITFKIHCRCRFACCLIFSDRNGFY